MTSRPLNAGAIALVLKDWDVDFVVVGGAAAYAHGTSRRPSDLDVVIRLAPDNLDNTVAALRELNARPYFPGITPVEQALLPPSRLTADVLEMSLVSTWMTSQGPLDLFDAVLSRSGNSRYYADLEAGSVRRRVDGIPVDVASIDAIIASKVIVGRPKDLDDVAELRRIVVDRALQRQPAVTSTHRQQLGRDVGIDR